MEKINRLKKRKEFNYIFKNGNGQSSEILTLVYINSKLPNYKIGFSVSKKIGNAVTRNKTKRKLKAVFHKISKNVKNGKNYIIVAKPSIANADIQKIEKNLTYVLEKTNSITK